MQLTVGQQAVVAHGTGPLRVTGDYATGKTTALRARVARLSDEGGRHRVLVICRSAGAARSFDGQATTFWGVALDLLARHGRPTRALSRRDQRALVADVLGAHPGRWPQLAAALDDGELLQEVADAVCHYQASWLGLEELRTHAQAAGEPERWEELASLTDEYLARQLKLGTVDWAGALVQAGLLLRDPAVAEAERRRVDHIVVDDFEQVSFASHRLLVSLCAPGDNLTVAGNLEAPVMLGTGGDRRWLDRFVRSFAAGPGADVALDERLAPSASNVLVRGLDARSEPDLAAEELLAAHGRGTPWSSMAVIVCQWEVQAGNLFEALARRGVPAVRAEGPDPWDAGQVPGEAVSVVSLEGCASRTWPVVVVTGCVEGGLPAEIHHPHLLDVELLEGPDVPTIEQRETRWEAEERRRFDLLKSRATEQIVFVTSSDGGPPPSRFLHGIGPG